MHDVLRLGAALILATTLATCAAAQPNIPTPPPLTTAIAVDSSPADRQISTANPVAAIPTSALPAHTSALHQLTGRIVFSHEHDIYVMNADGSGRTQLTTDPAADFDPVWSPTGTHIAFRSHRDGNEEVYVMNADGSAQTNLTRNPTSDYSPAWSPDGTKIAFASDRLNRMGNDIWVMDADGSHPMRLTTISGIQEYPAWAPDGKKLVFHCTFGRVLPQGVGDFEICVVNVDGSQLTQLTNAPGESKLPAWAPDGTRIVFQSNRHGWPTLPDYTPPAYEADRFGEYDIYVMDSTGANLVNLTNYPREDDSEPAWARDGSLIFSRYGCLMVLPPQSVQPRQITARDACADNFPDWRQAPSE
jgi:Tol biopolymer transport system component